MNSNPFLTKPRNLFERLLTNKRYWRVVTLLLISVAFSNYHQTLAVQKPEGRPQPNQAPPQSRAASTSATRLHFQSLTASFLTSESDLAIPEFRTLVLRAISSQAADSPQEPNQSGARTRPGVVNAPVPGPAEIKLHLKCDNGKEADFEVTGLISANDAIKWVKANCTSSVTVSWVRAQ